MLVQKIILHPVMPSIYTDSTYLQNNPTWHEEDAPFKAGKIMELLRRNHPNAETICEIGCGSGEILVQLAHQLPDTVFWGYDISPQATEIAKKERNRTHNH